MKKIKLFTIALFLIVGASAQTYQIDTSEISFENKLRAAYSVAYDAPSKTTKNAWADYFKKNYKIKVKGISLFSNKDIIDAEDVTISSISDKRMNMYARIVDLTQGSELKFFISFGYDFFVGPQEYPKEFSGMKELLNDFSVDFLKNYYADEAASLTKKVKSLEKDIKSNNRSISKISKKAKKESDAVASGLEAKNNSLMIEIEQMNREINEIGMELEQIKIKQGGITRN
jgi:hypothetical protein